MRDEKAGGGRKQGRPRRRDDGWFDKPRSLVLYDLRTVKASGSIVYDVLAAHKNRRGEAWPSQGRIMALTGYHRRTVQRALKRLADAAHIEVVCVGDGRRPTVYRVRGGVQTAPGAASGTPEGRSESTTNENHMNEKDPNEKAVARARRKTEPLAGYQEGRVYPGVQKTRALLATLRSVK